MSKRGLGYVSKHGRWWMLDVQLNGKRIRKQLGLVKLLEAREARRVADEFIAQKQAERFSPQQKGNMPFSEFAKKFLVRAMETKRSWAQYVGKSAEQTPLIHAVRFFGETLLREPDLAAATRRLLRLPAASGFTHLDAEGHASRYLNGTLEPFPQPIGAVFPG